MKSNQIRNVICAFRDSLPEIFPGSTKVPKTIIFAKDGSHADNIVREEFGESSDFCQKIDRATEDFKTKTILADFCTLFNPRIIVVTVE